MTEAQLNLINFKQRLMALAQRTNDVAEQVSSAGKVVELDQAEVGRLSRMDAMQNQAIAQAGAERQQLQLQEIENALSRIDGDDFGYCSKCAKRIAIARLKIDPVAEYCIECAEKLACR